MFERLIILMAVLVTMPVAAQEGHLIFKAPTTSGFLIN